jgi:hypothetical protein
VKIAEIGAQWAQADIIDLDTAVLVCVKYSELPRRKALSNPCVTNSAENRCINRVNAIARSHN